MDVFEAAGRIDTSGPFHFETTIRNTDGEQRTQGRANPSEGALEIHRHSGASDDRLAELFKDGRHWIKDNFGWFGGGRGHPFSDLRTLRPDLGLIPPLTEQVDCSGTAHFGGRELKVYRVEIGSSQQGDNEFSLYVDPETDHVVRFHKIGTESWRKDARPKETITNFRYDSTISIEPPSVDLAERQRASHAAFEIAKKSNPDCRNEALGALERGVNSGPFHFEFWLHGLMHPIHGMGSFLPSQAIHAKSSRAGMSHAKTENIFVEGKTWWRRADVPWQMAQDDEGYIQSMKTLMDIFKPNNESTVFKRCEPQRSGTDIPQRVYEFVIYGDRNHYGERYHAYKPVETRRLFVDVKTGLPVKSERLTADGKWSLIEKRIYDPAIRIMPPRGSVERGPSAPVGHR